MKSRAILSALLLSLFPCSESLSEERTFEGTLGATGYYLDVSGGEGGKAKFTEYRDLVEPWRIFGTLGVRSDSESRLLKFDANDMGYSTQRYQGRIDQYGKFKLDVFYDEIPHNVTFDARTFYSGAGTATLRSSANPSLDTNTWNTFDYSTKRKNLGTKFQLDAIKPFFFNTSFTREEKKGIKPAGIPATISPGAFDIELPEPVDYTTNNLKVEGGYGQNPLFVSFNYLYSDFGNQNHAVSFVGFPTPAGDYLTLPPDNTMHRFNLKGALKLPYNSKFSTNLAIAKTTSEHDFFRTYEGEVNTNNADVVLTSNPVRFLDTKAYYKYYSRDNNSKQTLLFPPASVPNLFDYKINTFGFDFGLRLPARLYLVPGYKYVKTEREFKGADPSEALPFNQDNIYSIELKWKGLDWATPRLGYERLDRAADFRTFNTTLGVGNTSNIFAYSPQQRDTYKIALDIYPTDALNFGMGYKYRRVDYQDDILGRISGGLNTLLGIRKDQRDEVNFSVDYTLKRTAKFYGYLDYEWITSDDTQWKQGAPNGFWKANQNERTWDYGIGTDIYVIPDKLTFTILHDYIKSNGFADLTMLNSGLFATAGPGANNSNIDNPNWDDYEKWGLTFKTAYHLTKALTVSLGYSYQRFRYSSAELDNYKFVNPPGGPVAGTSAAFLTGALKDQSYTANILFAGVTYRFD